MKARIWIEKIVLENEVSGVTQEFHLSLPPLLRETVLDSGSAHVSSHQLARMITDVSPEFSMMSLALHTERYRDLQKEIEQDIRAFLLATEEPE